MSISASSDSTNPQKRARLGDSPDEEQRPVLPATLGPPRRSNFDNCKALLTMPREEISAEENELLLHLFENYLNYFKVAPKTQTDTAAPSTDPIPGAVPSTNPVPASSTDPVPVSCVEPDWQDQAYKELLSIRNTHSSLLDEAYMNQDNTHKITMAANPKKKHLEKLVNFLGKSRDDIGALSRKECHDLMMSIKGVVAGYQGKTRVKNWRDQTYERLRSLRKKYSWKLDDAYKYVHGGNTQSKLLSDYKEGCGIFLEESLDFLAKSRADIVFLSEKTCCERLKAIECFVEDPDNSYYGRLYVFLLQADGFSGCQDQQETSLPNWRDLAYEEIQAMKEGFALGAYRYGFAVWCKIPKLYVEVEELGDSLESTCRFFKRPRHGMALLSEDENARRVKETARVVERMKELMGRLQKQHRIDEI